ncbi:hypothetical protein AB0H03_06540 [Streptomyces sparsogenes]|uniref:hypothetical protein n=1 Tax=Streptomyces sparsogenes TaxID=67365 RepID=UPI0033EC04FE
MDMQQLALEEAALKTLADAVTDRLKAVRASMQEAMDNTGASRVDATLPDGTKVATISSTSPKPTAQVVDEEKFRAWVREHSPANHVSRIVHEVRPAYQAALLAEMTAAGVAEVADKETGVVEEVPGVEIRATRSRGHSVRPVDGGREAIGAAWRNGQLAHLDIPQITAGSAA